MEKTLKLILTELKELKSEVTGLKGGQKSLKESQEKIESEVTGLKEGQKNLKKSQEKIESEVIGLKEGQKNLKKSQEKIEEGQSLLLKMHFEQEDKMNTRFEKFDKKLDKIYNNTDTIAKNFKDETQEFSMMQYRQNEQTKQLEGHEDRITTLEEKIA